MAIVKSTSEIDGEKVEIYIEVEKEPSEDDTDDFYRGATRGNTAQEAIKEVRDLVGDGLTLSRQCAAKVIDSVNKMNDAIKPNEFEVQLGIMLDYEVGAIIAKAGAGAQMQVTMKWNLKETATQSEVTE